MFFNQSSIWYWVQIPRCCLLVVEELDYSIPAELILFLHWRRCHWAILMWCHLLHCALMWWNHLSYNRVHLLHRRMFRRPSYRMQIMSQNSCFISSCPRFWCILLSTNFQSLFGLALLFFFWPHHLTHSRTVAAFLCFVSHGWSWFHV